MMKGTAAVRIPGPPDQIDRSVLVLTEHARATFWRRLMLAAFYTVFVITMLWAIPWLPYGTSIADYNERVLSAMLLGGMAATFAFAAVRLRGRVLRTEETLVSLSSVQHGIIDLRRREHFYNRLLAEQERSSKTGESFAVVVLRFTPGPDVPADLDQVHHVLEALGKVVSSFDCLAAIGPHEVAALVPRIDGREAPRLAERLRQAAASAQGAVDEMPVAAGWAVACPASPPDVGELLSQARRMLGRATARPSA